MPDADTQHQEQDLQDIELVKEGREAILGEVAKIIVGQQEVVDLVLMAIFCNGHSLLIGVPGLAKTLLVSTLSRALALTFKRIQFTPDLMPSDITGTDVLQERAESGERSFRFMSGPIFHNVILADEINRTPPKTQAALLEAMQERMISIGNEDHPLSPPFFVLATQNPIEQEGTYPLPEAQLDRFLFNVYLDYPDYDSELAIAKHIPNIDEAGLEPVLTRDDILRVQKVIPRVPIADHVVKYAVDLVRASRPATERAPKFVKNWVAWGAGPRASQYLVLAGKAHAVLDGRYHVSCDDIRQVAMPVLRHRLFVNFAAEAEEVDAAQIVQRLLKEVPEPTAR